MFQPEVRRLAALVLSLLALAPAAAPASEKSLRRSLSTAMAAAGPSSGAYVLNATDRSTVLSWRAGKRRILASNVKIFTSSAALAEFGPEGRFETSVLTSAPPDARGVVNGDLYLRGGGDPVFGSDSFVRRSYGYGATVEELAGEIAQAGVTRVTGRIVGDESRFDSLRGGPDSGYRTSIWVGPLSALAFNRGLARESGSAFQANPPAFAAQQLDRALSEEGIGVRGSARQGATPSNATQIASVESPAMSRLVQITNTRSDNFFAETLSKQVGVERLGAGTTRTGARATMRFARSLGAKPRLVDGSGLARGNRASPRHVARLLDRMRERDEFDVFYDSLPVAGRSGTLADRMRRGPARGRCHAKTGTISGVSALSGYCRSRGGDEYVFSFLMNGVNVYGARNLQDKMAQALARER